MTAPPLEKWYSSEMRVKITIKKARVNLKNGPVTVAAWVIDSGRPGPHLLLAAAQHGIELQGCEAIRLFVELAKRRLARGKITAIPFLNLPAISAHSQHIIVRRNRTRGGNTEANMNGYWSGTGRGNDIQRLAYGIFENFVKGVTHLLDLHTWTKITAPGVIIRDDPAFRRLAGQLGNRFVKVVSPRNLTLGGRISNNGGMGLTYEFSGQYSVDPDMVKKGLKIIINMALAIGIFRGRPLKGDGPVIFSDQCRQCVVKAPVNGLFVRRPLELSRFLKKGAGLGHILADDTLKTRELISPHDGYLETYGVLRGGHEKYISAYHPYVNKGEVLATITWPRGGNN
jgi:predicted deacylase